MFRSMARRTYRALLILYPVKFRREFQADLLLIFDDLIADRGVVAATTRTSVDLVVTVPRYRLEAVMNTSTADRTLGVGVVALPTLGLCAVLLGTPWLGAAFFAAGLILALAGGGRLARSIRTAPPSQRTRRLRGSAACLAVFVAATVGWLIVVGDEEASTLGLLGTSMTAMVALGGTAALLVAGLLTPRSELPSR